MVVMMKLVIRLKLGTKHMHIIRVGFERFKLPRMAYIISY